MSSPEALQVQRMSGSATVDVSDSRLVARGHSRVTGAYITLGSTSTAVTIVRSTLDAATMTGDGAAGVVFGYTTTALTLADCTVTARSGEEEAVGVDMYEALTGSLTIQRTAFTIIAAKGPAVSGGIIARGSPFTDMDGLHLTVSDSTFDGSSSAVPLLFVRLPRRWEGENRVAITNVTMTEQFNSTERGLVSMATDSNHGVYVKPGSSATRCLTGLVLGGAAVADNFALPGVPSTVDCATPAPTPSPTPASVPAASSSSEGTTPSPAAAPIPIASSSADETPAPSPSASSQQSSASVPATPQPTAAPGPSPAPTTVAPTLAPFSPAPTETPVTARPPTTPSPMSPATPGTPAPTSTPQTPSPSSPSPRPPHTPVPTSANGHRGGGHAAADAPDSTPALSTAATVSIAVVAGVAVIVAVIAVAAFLVIRRASRVSPVTTAPDDHRHNNGPFPGQNTTTTSAATTEQEMYRVDVFPAPGAVTDPDHNDPFGKLQHLSSEAVVVLGQVAQP